MPMAACYADCAVIQNAVDTKNELQIADFKICPPIVCSLSSAPCLLTK